MPINIKVYNQKAEEVGNMKLSDKVFGVSVNEPLVHQAMVAQQANERQVLAHAKDRSEVRGGGRKPWRQKGTGRARAGSRRSPIWIGGGVTFGPTKERNFKKKINKKMKQKALLMVLSDKVNSKSLLVLDKLSMDEYKTGVFNVMLAGLEKKLHDKKKKRSILVINDEKNEKVHCSGRNLAGVGMINLDNINILDLLKYREVILTKAGAKTLEARYK